MESSHTSHLNHLALADRTGAEAYGLGATKVSVECVRAALLASDLFAQEPREPGEPGAQDEIGAQEKLRAQDELGAQEKLRAQRAHGKLRDTPIRADHVQYAARSTSAKGEPGCGQMSLPGFDGGSIESVTVTRRAPLLEPLSGSLFAGQLGPESESWSKQESASRSDRSDDRGAPTRAPRSSSSWRPVLPAVRVGTRASRPLEPQNPVAAQHLDAAARLSRQIRATRRRSPEQVKTGRAICQHLLALLREETPGVS